ncbi:hypothetical protein I8J29_11150 [Paenibacillus sp. MWE-103]|uniref:Uncharacterized protein n=1 Tax=Paenibacillus artemisiicola TaxID=1172618 RepID=A0ABS3W8V8_9BACL|nr:hypothetical protein [Paenibacillus artemisiicola]MBO7744757.1 hypothetical protein [Paenibacillus artemisiicola]
MDRDRLEREARIALIGALSRSQTAVARILESVGDMTRHDPAMAMSIRRNLKSLAVMQRTLSEMVRAMERRPARPASGRSAAKPWLTRGAALPGGAGEPPKRKGGNRSGRTSRQNETAHSGGEETREQRGAAAERQSDQVPRGLGRGQRQR